MNLRKIFYCGIFLALLVPAGSAFAATEAEVLVGDLDLKNYGRFQEIQKSLIRIGGPAVEPLINKLREPGLPYLLRGIIYVTLGELRDSRAVAPLIAELNRKETMLNFDIAEALGKINDPSALHALSNKSFWVDPRNRYAAAKARFTIEESLNGEKLDYKDVSMDVIEDGAYIFTIMNKTKYMLDREGIVNQKWTPLELSIMPGYKLPARRINKVTGLSFGGYNLTTSVYGAQLGGNNVTYGKVVPLQAGFVNTINGDLYGLQAGIIGNNVEKKLYGIQLGGVYNLATDGYGLQAGFLNIVEPQLYGFQFGVVNATAGTVCGAQAGLINWTVGMVGMQVGLLNIVGFDQAGACSGLQLGLVNYCGGTLKGLQIGLFNQARSALFPWSVGLNAGF